MANSNCVKCLVEFNSYKYCVIIDNNYENQITFESLLSQIQIITNDKQISLKSHLFEIFDNEFNENVLITNEKQLIKHLSRIKVKPKVMSRSNTSLPSVKRERNAIKSDSQQSENSEIFVKKKIKTESSVKTEVIDMNDSNDCSHFETNSQFCLNTNLNQNSTQISSQDIFSDKSLNNNPNETENLFNKKSKSMKHLKTEHKIGSENREISNNKKIKTENIDINDSNECIGLERDFSLNNQQNSALISRQSTSSDNSLNNNPNETEKQKCEKSKSIENMKTISNSETEHNSPSIQSESVLKFNTNDNQYVEQSGSSGNNLIKSKPNSKLCSIGCSDANYRVTTPPSSPPSGTLPEPLLQEPDFLSPLPPVTTSDTLATPDAIASTSRAIFHTPPPPSPPSSTSSTVVLPHYPTVDELIRPGHGSIDRGQCPYRPCPGQDKWFGRKMLVKHMRTHRRNGGALLPPYGPI